MLMAGAGAESTLECQKMCETMALAGADCFLIVTPSFYKMSEYALIRHFTEVADFSPKPIVISNLPNNTSVKDSLWILVSTKFSETKFLYNYFWVEYWFDTSI